MDLERIRESYANLTDSQMIYIYQNEFNQLDDEAKAVLLQEIQKRGIDKESPPAPLSVQEKIFAEGSPHPLRYFVYFGWIWGLLQIYMTFMSFSKEELPFRIALDVLGIIWIVAAVGVGKLKRWGYSLALAVVSLQIVYNLVLTIPVTAQKISTLFFSGKMKSIGIGPQASLLIWIFWLVYLLLPKTRNLFKK